MNFDLLHGGNREALASELGISSFQLIDASSSLFPWTPRLNLNKKAALRDYPDRQYKQLCKQIAQIHGVAEEAVLPVFCNNNQPPVPTFLIFTTLPISSSNPLN